MKKKVLFICNHNSARSQMAEALLNRLCPEEFEAESAGLTPGTLNPFAVEVLKEIGIDITGKRPRSTDEVLGAGTQFAHVITVCDDAQKEQCPIFPGGGKKLHMSFPDPSSFVGDAEAKLAFTRSVRDMIEKRLREWCNEVCAQPVQIA
jgi:arsenate reductase (thioredoxin)